MFNKTHEEIFRKIERTRFLNIKKDGIIEKYEKFFLDYEEDSKKFYDNYNTISDTSDKLIMSMVLYNKSKINKEILELNFDDLIIDFLKRNNDINHARSAQNNKLIYDIVKILKENKINDNKNLEYKSIFFINKNILKTILEHIAAYEKIINEKNSNYKEKIFDLVGIENIKVYILNKMKFFLNNFNYKKINGENFEKYINNEIKLNKVKFFYESPRSYVGHEYDNIIDTILLFNEFNDLNNKIINFIMSVHKDLAFVLIKKGIDKYNFIEKSFMNLNKKYNISLKNMIITTLNAYYFSLLRYKEEKCFSIFLDKYPIEFLESLELLCLEKRIMAIDYILREDIFKSLKDEHKAYFWKIMKSLSKIKGKEFRKKLIEVYSKKEDVINTVIKFINDKNTNTRDFAIEFLSLSQDKKIIKALKERLDIEKNISIKLKLNNILLSDNEELSNDIFTSKSKIEDYCKKNINKRKMKIISEYYEDAPILLTIKNKEVFSEDVLLYYLNIFASDKLEELNKEAVMLSKVIDKKSLEDLGMFLLNKWIENVSPMKRKWVLYASTLAGGQELYDFLRSKIISWDKDMKVFLGANSIRALAFANDDKAIIIIDELSQTKKRKKIKQTIIESLDLAAKNRGITKDELGDMLISDLGFDEYGVLKYNYGKRDFSIKINKNFKYEIISNEGKKFKNLPKPGVNDDTKLANHAFDEFKSLKKNLKKLIKSQTIRLERALLVNRTWKSEKWLEVFIKNKVMQNFASSLIWGIYEDNKLKLSFRYMEDGTFCDMNDDEIQINKNELIQLVHPIDLEKESLKKWKEQLSDYKIKQAFPQLGREIFIAKNSNEKEFIDFNTKIITKYKLLNDLDKKGWLKGVLGDHGDMNEIYIENEMYKIGAQVNIEGFGYGGSGFDATVSDIVFYKLGTMQRKGYGSHKPKDEDKIVLKELPKRFFSEVLHDIKKVSS